MRARRPPIRVVVHLSDLHFGRVGSQVVEPLLDAVHKAEPHLTVISGDFVQNGWRSEFEQARDFVRQLPKPILPVPGNHDMPFANYFGRLTTGLARYRQYISPDTEPFFLDDELAVMGITTARRLQLRGGRIAEAQIHRIEQRLAATPPGRVKILVSHHPFDLAESYHRRELVGRARAAMGRFAQSVDILLAGHMHLSHAGHTAVRYKLQGRSAIFVQAGTATSTRGRGEPNAFNILRIARPDLTIERHQYRGDAFHCACTDRFALHIDPPATSHAAVNPTAVHTDYPR